jgi:hypothetical protein
MGAKIAADYWILAGLIDHFIWSKLSILKWLQTSPDNLQ